MSWVTTYKYYAFDMDHTIGDFKHFEFFLRMFKVNEWLEYLKVPRVNISESLQNRIDLAYKDFVNQIASHIFDVEMFNPFILNKINDILSNKDIDDFLEDSRYREQDSRYTEQETRYLILYTNNPQREKVQCIVDILNTYYKRELFCIILDWHHPLRADDRKDYKEGFAIKQWDTLKTAILQVCGADGRDIKPSEVVYFDDYVHKSIKKVLGENYNHVEEFNRNINKGELFGFLYESLEKYDLDEDDEYMKILAKVFEKPFMNDTYLQLWFQGLIEAKVYIHDTVAV